MRVIQVESIQTLFGGKVLDASLPTKCKEATVRSKWRRYWPFVALTLTALTVVIVHVAVDHYTREPPNYSRIEEGLWLGGNVRQPPPGTQSVLNLCEGEDAYHVLTHKWAPIKDGEPVPNLDWLEEQVGFIKSERAAGRTVYVHCMNGVSRSGMVMTAYFMQREGWTRDRALDFLRSHRPGVRPNRAFMDLLLEWECMAKR
jgi:protein tyrosine phosphatase